MGRDPVVTARPVLRSPWELAEDASSHRTTPVTRER